MLNGKPHTRMSGHAKLETQSARQNQLLAALPAAVYRRLLPYLERVALPVGRILFPPLAKIRYAYFPTTSIVALTYAVDKGVTATARLVGNEGVVGLSSLSGASRNDQASVQTAGHAFRLSIDILRAEFRRGGAFQQLMLRYWQVLVTQASQLGVCNLYHALDKRLCRFLLHAFDQAPADELAITHQSTADLLGVRRVGVTEAVGRLHAVGVIRSGRGHLTLLNRRKLEALACTCYGTIKKEFDGLLPDNRANR